MELTIISPAGNPCTIPLDGISYDLFMVNPNYAESVSKTYSLPLKVPSSLFPVGELAPFMAPGGIYSSNKLDGFLSDGTIHRPCKVVFENTNETSIEYGGDIVTLSIEYADLPLDIMGKKISKMDLGVWRFDQPLSTWAETARIATAGLISFPMIYAPEFFKKNYDEKFQGDTDYINKKSVEYKSDDSPYLKIAPIHIFIYDPQHPEDWELHNDNALIPCIHLSSLLRRIFDTFGYRLNTDTLPPYFEDIYLSTLKYPELPTASDTDVAQTGLNKGTKTIAVGDPGARDGNDWIFFEQYLDIPKQYSGCTVTVTLNSGTLYPCKDMNQDVPYGKYVPTVFKCVMDNINDGTVELDESLLRETIEDEKNLDKAELKYTFQFVRKTRANGYSRPRIQFRGSNIFKNSTYPSSVKSPYVEDLQATITYAFDQKKTYEIFLRPKDYSAFVEIKTTDFINFDTFSDLYTALKNSFGISFITDIYSKIITAVAPSKPPVKHDFQEYSPRSFTRNFNNNNIDQAKIIVVKSANEDSPVVSISPKTGVNIYENAAAYEKEKDEFSEETIKDTGLFPLRTKRQMAAFSSNGAGNNNIFFAPLASVEGISLTETNKAVARMTIADSVITLELDSLYRTALKYVFNSVYQKEKYQIKTYIPSEYFLQVNSADKIYICDKEYELIEVQAESVDGGYIVTFTVLG